MSNYRKLHFGTEVWKYKIGGRKGSVPYVIEVRDPSNKKHMIKTNEMLGIVNPDNILRGIRKGWLHITPSQIKKYITEHFRGLYHASIKQTKR
jgi:hypothetical protein